MTDGGSDVDSRLATGMRLTLARNPRSEEVEELREYYESELAYFQSDHRAASSLLAVGQSTRDERLDLEEHAAYTSVARLLLNLDETLTKN